MIKNISDATGSILGLDDGSLDLTIAQMIVRALVVYAVAIVLLRVANKRFLGQNTVFDIILGIMLGSILSRAITGSSAFFPTLAAGSALVLLHWMLALATYHLDARSTLIKGRSQLIIQDGEIDRESLRRNHLSERDLLESLRLRGGVNDPASIREAHLERSGDISVIGDSRTSPQIIEVDVQDGVQVVRIEIQ